MVLLLKNNCVMRVLLSVRVDVFLMYIYYHLNSTIAIVQAEEKRRNYARSFVHIVLL